MSTEQWWKGSPDEPGRRSETEAVRGEQHWNSRLTELDVRRAREAYSAGNWTIAQLAAKLGVKWKTMNDAVRGVTWKHVPGAVPREVA